MKLSNLSSKPRVVSEEEDRKGSIETMKKLSDWVTNSNGKIKAALDSRDIRDARLYIKELRGMVEQLSDHAELISKDIGLPDLE